MEKFKEIAKFLVDTGMKWSDDRATRLAAALAYYMLFSMAPLLIILAGVTGRLLDQAYLTTEFNQQVSNIVGPEAAEWIASIIEGASAPSSFTLATIISLGIMFWGASNVFHHIKETLNFIWRIKKAPGREGILATIRGRLLAFAVVLISGLLLVSYVVTISLVAVIVPFLENYIPEVLDRLPGLNTVQIVQYLILFVGASLLFAFIYKMLPDAEIAWRDVIVGALFTAVLFGIGTFALGIYFRFSNVGSLYGAAGSIMVILVWFYYSAQIFLFGAEFTHMYAMRYGSKIRPSGLAVAVETRTVGDDDSANEEAALGPGKAANATTAPNRPD